MEATLNIQVGRLRSRPDGLWELIGPDGDVVAGPDGAGLTKWEAEALLDVIEQRLEAATA
jgi:hypothetical protein